MGALDRWIIRGGLHGACIVYDLRSNGSVIHEISDYTIYLQDLKGRSVSTVDLLTNHLVVFYQFISQSQTPISRVTDDKLKAFREDQLRQVKANPRYRGSERLAMATVNQKLTAIYQWLVWLKETRRSHEGLIGVRDCQVTIEVAYQRTNGLKWRWPLLYQSVEKGKKHRTGYVATRSALNSLTEFVMDSASSAHLRYRDALLLDIASTVGFRVGSICSLLTEQFELDALRKSKALTFLARPERQKFSREDDYELPVDIGLRVCEFISGPLADHLEAKGEMARNARGHVFISDKDCRPITSRAMTQRISRLMQSLGAPKGTSIHSWRSFYCVEEIEREIDERLALGLDVSTDSVCAAVSQKLGHRNPRSIYAYVVYAQSKRARERAATARSHLVALESRIAEQDREIAILKRELTK